MKCVTANRKINGTYHKSITPGPQEFLILLPWDKVECLLSIFKDGLYYRGFIKAMYKNFVGT